MAQSCFTLLDFHDRPTHLVALESEDMSTGQVEMKGITRCYLVKIVALCAQSRL